MHTTIAVMLFLVALSCTSKAAKTDNHQNPTANSVCAFSDSAFDATTDVKALDEYRDAIAVLLKQEKFAQLDCVGNAAREGKTRFSGGGWKLRNFYIGLDTPRPGHPTQVDWDQHFQLLQRWKSANPKSIAATIALAESYERYAWDARGDGFADSVSDSGWKLFAERAAKAKAILDEASDLSSKDPDWYVGMQYVAHDQSWKAEDIANLLNRAIAFEPGYQYYQRIHANYLQPKWSGEEGDAARFAETTANGVGGDAGDILYFQIADAILCACQETEFGRFSWPRLQAGFEALEKKYGTSMMNVNSLALMAAKSGDWVAADAAFKRIGESYNEELWTSESWFQQMRDTAAKSAPMQLQQRAARQEAEANLKTKEGADYQKAFEAKVETYERACVAELSGDEHKSELYVQIGKTGSADNAHTEHPPDRLAYCVMRALYASYTNKETPFPAPPHAPYWTIVTLDPASLAASK